jgi:hypothetical protein
VNQGFLSIWLKLVNGQFAKTGKIGVKREALGVYEALHAQRIFWIE